MVISLLYVGIKMCEVAGSYFVLVSNVIVHSA